jgi:Protein of unknown function (DUF5672)
MNKLDLPSVTLVCADMVCRDLSRLAVMDCIDCAEFGEVVTVSDVPMGVPGARNLAWPKWEWLEDWQSFIWYEVPKIVTTDHFLVVHWDSWIVDPTAWDPRFLQFDYVGAPWAYDDRYNVGNGGFSLRSMKLAAYVAGHKTKYKIGVPEDDFLCRRYGLSLQMNGFRFADTPTAMRFSQERVRDDKPHFGFHNMVNFPRYLSREEIVERMKLAPEYVTKSAHYREMVAEMDRLAAA